MRSTQLCMRWIPVADASGRTRLQAVWTADAAAGTTPSNTPVSTSAAANEAA